MQQKANVTVYLVLCRNNEILLSKTHNIGSEPGIWSLISGYREINKSGKESIIIDAKEELGINISYKDLNLGHIIHRKTDSDNIDIFMVCKKWDGEISNKQPNKCSELKFFSQYNLPKNILKHIKIALAKIYRKQLYNELGWNTAS